MTVAQLVNIVPLANNVPSLLQQQRGERVQLPLHSGDLFELKRILQVCLPNGQDVPQLQDRQPGQQWWHQSQLGSNEGQVMDCDLRPEQWHHQGGPYAGMPVASPMGGQGV